MRLLGIDYGEKRIGLAITDPLKIFVKPFDTIDNDSIANVIEKLKLIIKTQQIEKIILGLPVSVSGEESTKTIEVKDFYNELLKNLDVPINFWDERYSTVEANEFLIKKGVNWKKSRKEIDKIAAAVILKSYLDTNTKRGHY